MSSLWSIYAPDVDLEGLAAEAGPAIEVDVSPHEDLLRQWMREDHGLDAPMWMTVRRRGTAYRRDLPALIARVLLAGSDVLVMQDDAVLLQRRSGVLRFELDAEFWKPLVYAALERQDAPAA